MDRLVIFTVIRAATFALLPYVALAAPAVTGTSGNISHGEAVTVSGSGFGTHAGYNNLGDSWKSGRYLNFRFKDFEDAQLNSHGFYPQMGGSPWSPSSTALSILSGGPTNSTKFMRRAYAGENGGLSADVQGSSNKLYTTFKFKADLNTQSGKMWRMYADSPQNNVYLATGCSNYLVRGFSECTAGSCSGASTEWGTGPELTPGQWKRVEILADGGANKFTVWVNGVQAWSKSNWLNSNLLMNGHTVDYPNMIDSGTRDASCPAVGAYNYDDIFVDFTAARVELGDASTWTAVRRKEIQLPVTWSDGSVQIRVNTGEFQAGNRVYLYIIDSQGAVNANGFAVTIGGQSTPTPTPNPPDDVQAR